MFLWEARVNVIVTDMHDCRLSSVLWTPNAGDRRLRERRPNCSYAWIYTLIKKKKLYKRKTKQKYKKPNHRNKVAAQLLLKSHKRFPQGSNISEDLRRMKRNNKLNVFEIWEGAEPWRRKRGSFLDQMKEQRFPDG